MRRHKILPGILSVFILFFTISTLQAQQLEHVQGEILIKLWPEVEQDVSTWLESKRTLNGTTTKVAYKREVSAPMDIHLISFDHNTVNEKDFLESIQDDPMVQAAQYDYLVKLRLEPDDPQFSSQWQYMNNANADIDMDLAWDIATGGLTPEGDTIVACIIDDGINLNHPDMIDNLWINHAEIPNNGIDDDNNGFVDDYRGYDTFSNNDEVGDGGGHGTPVAGIVGAVGNNGIGVAGVNWAVKLMIVQGGTGVQSEVLEAYSYPLIARQRYNATNGEEGAFVVSTNASWGIDQGQPSNAPLWCAFYDTLGVHGILNCGATANANFNIDVVGDLPTACPSDYLISVTNMNNQDVKVTQAGYGAETIDLGAFGQGTWTTSFGSYGGFGGTSGATPHVTGTIALMYSAPCGTLTAIAKSNPGMAAAMVRDFILNGVDPNASLDGITTTGGRLNVNNAMMDLMANCGPCPPPASLAISNLVDVSADLSWISNDSTLTNDINWREVGSTDWILEEGVSNPHTLTGLVGCSQYEVQVLAGCNSENSVSAIFTFQTDGCCTNPTDLTVTDIQENNISTNWSGILAAESYNLRTRIMGGSDWTEVNTADLNYNITGLEACADYELQIKVLCANDAIDYSESVFFRTLGCGACLDFNYCDHRDLNAEDEWIQRVKIGDEENISGSDSGYGNFELGEGFTLKTMTTYDFELAAGYAGYASLGGWRIWIDYNQDGDFADEGERAFNLGTLANTTVIDDFTIPEDALLGPTRMRVVMTRNQLPTSCDGIAVFGEVEDYCLTIEQGDPSSTKNELSNLQGWEIYPNPASENLAVELNFTSPQSTLQIELINQLGQTMQEQRLQNVAAGRQQTMLNISELSEGIYFLRLRNAAGETEVKRVLRVD